MLWDQEQHYLLNSGGQGWDGVFKFPMIKYGKSHGIACLCYGGEKLQLLKAALLCSPSPLRTMPAHIDTLPSVFVQSQKNQTENHL